MNKKFKLIPFVISILIPLIVGFLSSLFVGDNIGLFENVQKPPFSPPAFLFGIVWPILYILLGISSYLALGTPECQENFCLRVYAINLILNFFWSIIFFNFQAYFVAFIWLLLLIISTVWLIITFYRSNKLAGILNIPYLVWICFAAVLNFCIYLLN